MRLKSLEIHGFKSFADKTKLEFHEGVTGIVGPNGCGKSNIVDAMRWVLGETSAKALRGGEMADVIFNGTDRRSALGMAEVTLTLADCAGTLETDYDEVAIGRRVFRDGKGEYLINKQPCRLKDINNLLMDTGIGRSSYSVMEQGKIDMLLSSKPEDRRAVFEEAAGITRYKSQKKEAIRKLDYTEANLVRIRDVIAENERQIRSLSRQASKAKRYQNLYDDVKTLELHLSHKQWREVRAEKAELATSIRALRLQQDELEDAIEKRQAAMASARVEYQEIENRLSELQGQLARLENETDTARNRIEFNGERAHELSVLIRKNEEEIETTREKVERQREDIAASDRHLAEIEERITDRHSEVASAESETADARQRREDLSVRLREIDEERSGLRSRIASLSATIETNETQSESDRLRHLQFEEEVARLRADETERRDEANELRSRIDEQHRGIEEFEETLAEMDQKYHQAKRAASDLQEDLAELHKLRAEKQSRLDVLEQLLAEGEGFEKGTRAVINEIGTSENLEGRVHLPLSRYLQVEPDFADAIEVALGQRLQAVLVEDIAVAEEVVSRLRRDSLGTASLVARDHAAAAAAPSQGKAPLGAIDWAADRIESDPSVEPLVRSLLAGTVLAEDLPTAHRLRERNPDLSVATLDGCFVTREGIVQGGRAGDDSVSILRIQNEIAELRELSQSLGEEVTRRQDRRDELNERVDHLEETLQQSRERLQQKRVAASKQEGRHALLERDLNQLRNRIESIEWEKREVAERTASIAETLRADLGERASAEGRIDELDRESGDAASALAEARTGEEKLTERVTEARTALAVEQGTLRNLQEQREPMLVRLEELESRIETAEVEIGDYRTRIEQAAIQTESLQETIRICEEKSRECTAERETIGAERESYSVRIEEGEQELTEKRREVQSVAEQRGEEEVKSAQLDIQLENLERVCRERYRSELEFFEPDSHALLLAIENRKNGGNARNRKTSLEPQPEPPEADGASMEPGSDEPGADSSSDEIIAEVEDPAEPDWEFVEETVAQLRTKLDSMGPVNIDAIEEFDELEEHYRFNVQQLEDLENSKEELLRMIARINRDTRRMFSETFEKIRKNFREMFKELFGEKAKADLLLMDDGDPLESGIDIIAKPPGKKLQSISLLSGGERSMTAVALLFGIYMVKPSPFCVLDELDAPLDEANIGRFIRVLDRFIGGSQFVIVTHSKRTMSRADVMYGVSMEEFGVSKTVGVTFSRKEKATALETAGGSA